MPALLRIQPPFIKFNSRREPRESAGTYATGKHRLDDAPLTVAEFITHDSWLQLGDLNHVRADTFKGKPPHIRNYPLTGHMAEASKSTRLTHRVSIGLALPDRF